MHAHGVVGDSIEQRAVVRDDDADAAKALESRDQQLARLGIKVIGRLVEHQHGRLCPSAAPTCHRLRSPGDNVGHRASAEASRRNSPWIRRATPSVARANAAISGVIVSTVCAHARITPRGGSRLTCPAVGSSSPAISRSSVVLPAPLDPTTPRPSGRERERHVAESGNGIDIRKRET